MVFETRRIEPFETWPLRASRLWPEKEEGPACALPTDEAKDAFHIGAFDGGVLVSVASVVVQPHPKLGGGYSHRLRAMATAESHIGLGAGRSVIRHVEATLKGQGVSGIWCDARYVALGFYARVQWDITGPSYEVPLRGVHRLAHREF